MVCFNREIISLELAKKIWIKIIQVDEYIIIVVQIGERVGMWEQRMNLREKEAHSIDSHDPMLTN